MCGRRETGTYFNPEDVFVQQFHKPTREQYIIQAMSQPDRFIEPAIVFNEAGGEHELVHPEPTLGQIIIKPLRGNGL